MIIFIEMQDLQKQRNFFLISLCSQILAIATQQTRVQYNNFYLQTLQMKEFLFLILRTGNFLQLLHILIAHMKQHIFSLLYSFEIK